jgi:predicted SnoaL-like aldol condensation-catalyzing enzyme
MELRSNKNIVAGFYEDVVKFRKSELINDYVREDYIQHSSMGKDGRAGLFEMVEFLKALPIPAENTKSPIVNILGEGDYVVVHLDLVFMGNRTVLIELFRLQDGQAAEHWDVTNEQSDDKPIVNIKGAVNTNALSNKAFITHLYSQFKTVVIHHTVTDGDRVAVHAELKGEKSIALFDVFKIEDNQITQHVHVKQTVPDKMLHNNGMF